MNDEVMTELMTEYLKESFPVKRIRLPKSDFVPRPRGNFKRAIKINANKVYPISDKDQRYNALVALSKILSKVFHVHQDDTVPILKKHLHIK
jgi:hypothetical protein